MRRRKDKQSYILDSVESIFQLEEPAAIDIEKVILFQLLSGKFEKEIFDGLDADCFYLPDHVAMFSAARELYEKSGSVPGRCIYEMTGTFPDKMKEYLSKSSLSLLHLEYFIKILQFMKLRRAVIWESVAMIANAMDEHYNVDELANDCERYSERVKSRGVTRIKDPNKEDWYAKDGDPAAERYLVRKGKNGWSDYCIVDSKIVSEPQMINLGFKRISLPVEKHKETKKFGKQF